MSANQSLTVWTTTVGDIPVMNIAPVEAQQCPVVFFIPGFTGRKESGLSLGHQLAHTMTPTMEQDAAEWFNRHLVEEH